MEAGTVNVFWPAVVVHVGFAISQVDEEEAARTLADLRELGELADKFGD